MEKSGHLPTDFNSITYMRSQVHGPIDFSYQTQLTGCFGVHRNGESANGLECVCLKVNPDIIYCQFPRIQKLKLRRYCAMDKANMKEVAPSSNHMCKVKCYLKKIMMEK